MRSPLSRPLVRLVLLTVLVALLAAPADARSYSARRYDVRVEVQPDGGLVVREDVQFAFQGGPYRRVFREIPTRRTDGVTDVTALLEDAPLPPGSGERQVEIERRSDRVRVVWHLPPTSDAVVRVGLVYRVHGVAERVDGYDRVAWTALPREHDYAIDASRTTVTWPATTPPFDSAEARDDLWRKAGDRAVPAPRVSFSSQAATFEVGNIRRDASFRVAFRFPPGSLTPRLARWQQRQVDRAAAARDLASLAALIGLLGLAFVTFLWARSPRAARESAGRIPPEAMAPDARPVAIASALRRRASGARHEDVVPTLLDLARRGALRVDELPAGRWSGRKFSLIKEPVAIEMEAHERVIFDALFADPGVATPAIELSKVPGRVHRRWKQYQATVHDAMVRDGLIDADRLAARRRLQRVGVALLVLGGVGLVLSGVLWGDRFGGAVVLPGVAVLIVSGAAFIAASTLSPLSDRGEREGARWRALAGNLRDLSKGRGALVEAARLERWLPYAAAAGVGVALAKRAHREGRPLPAWFGAMPGENRDGALVAMLSSSAASGGAHGASGGGGAAGGGSSGAS